jgi:hypothetical protein
MTESQHHTPPRAEELPRPAGNSWIEAARPDPWDPNRAHNKCHSRAAARNGRPPHRKTVSPELCDRRRPPAAVHHSLRRLCAERHDRERLLVLHRLAAGRRHHRRHRRWQRPGMLHLRSFCRGPEPSGAAAVRATRER